MKYCSLHRRYFTVEHLSCKSSYLWKSMWQWTFLCIYKSHSFQRKPFIPPPSPFQALHSTCLFCTVYNYILSMKFSYLVLFLAAVPCVKPHASLCYLLHPPRLRHHNWSWCLCLQDSHEAYIKLVLRVISIFHGRVYIKCAHYLLTWYRLCIRFSNVLKWPKMNYWLRLL